VHGARDQHGLTWSEIGVAFGVTMQSAHSRFGRPRPKPTTRLRR
jgi:hypothetical protein